MDAAVVGKREVFTMESHSSVATDESGHNRRPAVIESLETKTATAFVAGGGLLVASLLVPIGLGALTDRAWVAGLVLAGIAVVALAAGLLGLSRLVEPRRSLLANTGAASAVVAGVGGLALIGLVGVGLGAGVEPASAMGPFLVLATTMIIGVSLGFVLVGLASWRADGATPVGGLLLADGVVLLVPVFGESLGGRIGLAPPTWVVFPALAMTGIVALVVGSRLRTARAATRTA